MPNNYYKHFDIEYIQKNRTGESVCGDTILWKKNIDSTICILCDGKGHGIKASIYSKLFASRIYSMLEYGFSLKDTVASLAKTNLENMGKDLPYSAFSILKILNDGKCDFIGYQSPAPILLTEFKATPLKTEIFKAGGEIVEHSTCYLEKNEGIMIMSDGITQAGTGSYYNFGWETSGLCDFINQNISNKKNETFQLITDIQKKVFHLNKDFYGDDSTIALIKCRQGKVINILTGPPENKENDYSVVKNFINTDGVKIVCGDTTSKMVSRILKKQISIETDPESLLAPPRYYIEGIYLATEGAVTLNQVFNIIDEPNQNVTGSDSISVLYSLLNIADKIRIFHGKAENNGNSGIEFKQRGILKRSKILPLLINKLKSVGKLIEYKSF